MTAIEVDNWGIQEGVVVVRPRWVKAGMDTDSHYEKKQNGSWEERTTGLLEEILASGKRPRF